jgi:hypothetical protein
VPLLVIQRQLGHYVGDPAIRSRYLRGIDNTEIVKPSTSDPNRWFQPAGNPGLNADRHRVPENRRTVRPGTRRGLTRRSSSQEQTPGGCPESSRD